MANTLRPSEFEKKGVTKLGIQAAKSAWERLRVVYRSGQSEAGSPNIDVEPDDWGTGGYKTEGGSIQQ